MKRISFFLMALAILASGCQKRSQEFTVSGDLLSARLPSFTEKIALVSDAIETPIEVVVNDDHAFQIEGSVEKPVLAQLKVVGPEVRFSQQFILEEGAITFRNGSACGTPLNDAIFQFSDQIKEIAQDARKDPEARAKDLEGIFFSFVAEHKNDPCAIYAILKSVTVLPADSVAKLIGTASRKIQKDETVRAWKDRLKQAK